MNQLHPTPEEIVDYLHGEVSPSRDAAIHAHLAGCAECAEIRDSEQSLTEMLKAYARAEERELPSGVVATIRDAVRYQPPTLWERLSAAFRPAVAVPVAIAIAAFMYFGFRFAHGPAAASTIDASYYVESHAALSGSTPLSEDQPVPGELTDDAQPH
ncbi:MAG TPA: zf-HC2 domain-containing protein [Candidatus Cybelea sp.]|jgi:anti-sigma factor RsiW|nr:zf-HC2 domain-containing protein [Candidatus Cybelea sp.]